MNLYADEFIDASCSESCEPPRKRDLASSDKIVYSIGDNPHINTYMQ